MSTKRLRINIIPKTGKHGLSNNVNFLHLLDNDTLVQEQRSSGLTDENWDEGRAQFRNLWEHVSFQQENLFNSSGNGTKFADIPIHDSDADDDNHWHDQDFQMAVGNEGAINSNAGGEFLYHTLLDNLLKEAPTNVDMRTRLDRTEKQTRAWEEQIPRLLDGYLYYKARGFPDPSNDTLLKGGCFTIPTIDFYSA
ncbi:hypothetical protein V5O48_017466 [Marasmius crinis-equi]|uniref:Uncharacterized protein n=1 Tax=Marasmius crinis-equi TaxID=585013 RepID=A0ABR3ENZ0_9AGAR